MSYVICCSKLWIPSIAEEMQRRTGESFSLMTRKDELSMDNLKPLKPKIIFLPHWSFMIPKEILTRYECVIFHMTDVPFGRGGSPLQNLISRGIAETKLSALRATEDLDAGDVYLKKNLTLEGKAQEIYIRLTKLVMDMMIEIVKDKPIPKPQEDSMTLFKRRKPEQSNIKDIQNLKDLYDHIRMLDADGYPKAYLETDRLRFEFTDAVFDKETLRAQVTIALRKQAP